MNQSLSRLLGFTDGWVMANQNCLGWVDAVPTMVVQQSALGPDVGLGSEGRLSNGPSDLNLDWEVGDKDGWLGMWPLGKVQRVKRILRGSKTDIGPMVSGVESS